MNVLAGWYYNIHNAIFPRLQHLDGLAPLALRLYLVPVFWMAGTKKIASIDSTIEWFGNADWGLGDALFNSSARTIFENRGPSTKEKLPLA